MQHVLRALIVSLVLVGLSPALAQVAAPTTPLPEGAAVALADAEARMSEALATYPAHYPDRPLWQQTYQAARRAARLAPDRPEPVRFLAEAYSRSRWYGPAWETWREYVRRWGAPILERDREAQELVAEVGHELGWGAYARGDTELALDFYLSVIDLVPWAVEPHVWVGRILLETERPEQAVPFWRRVTELDPGDARAAYFLELARQQAVWGTRAVNAFREGVAHYEGGRFTEAEEQFARAAVLNPAYYEAWAWQGRIAFERGDYAQAARLYARALELDPANATYAHFRDESRRRLQD
jgi:tetratricopeptide (TPR) repeat protein